MKVLYIGHYNVGATSRMRGERLKDILPISEFRVVNIDEVFNSTSRIFKSLGWRFKFGPLINRINGLIAAQAQKKWDLVWVDKGVFIHPKVLHILRGNCKKLVHFTPDPAFTYHRSKRFFQSIPKYDYCITTKSFEVSEYRAHGAKKVLFCTQGFDQNVHRPMHSFYEKDGIVFIGHWEKNREEVIKALLEIDIPVTLAGIHWERFVKKNRSNSNLNYLGTGVFGEEYVFQISKAKIGLGFNSFIIPELHTTRTFEIPACGTAIALPENKETRDFYTSEQALFLNEDLNDPQAIFDLYFDENRLKIITENGHERVISGCFEYGEILTDLCLKMQLI